MAMDHCGFLYNREALYELERFEKFLISNM